MKWEDGGRDICIAGGWQVGGKAEMEMESSSSLLKMSLDESDMIWDSSFIAL